MPRDNRRLEEQRFQMSSLACFVSVVNLFPSHMHTRTHTHTHSRTHTHTHTHTHRIYNIILTAILSLYNIVYIRYIDNLPRPIEKIDGDCKTVVSYEVLDGKVTKVYVLDILV